MIHMDKNEVIFRAFQKACKYLREHPPQMPTALEAGTLNGHGIAGLGAAVRYLQETGLDTIRAKEQELMWEFYSKVREIPGITGATLMGRTFCLCHNCAILVIAVCKFYPLSQGIHMHSLNG